MVNCSKHLPYSFLSLLLLLILILATVATCKPKQVSQQELSKIPKRIAISNILGALILWEYGLAWHKRVVALPYTIDNAEYSPMAGMWPKNIARIHYKLEDILLTQPELLILSSFQSKSSRELIKKLGIPCIILDGFRGFSDYRKNIRKLSTTLRVSKKGEEIIERFNKRLKRIQEVARKKIPPKLKAMTYLYGNTAGSETTFDDIINAAGLENLSKQKGGKSFEKISLEKLVLWNPDIIIIACGKISCHQSVKNFRKLPGIRHTLAFQENTIIALPSHLLTSTSEFMLDAAEMLQAKVLQAKIRQSNARKLIP